MKTMPNINTKKIIYFVRTRLLTLNSVVVIVALVIAIGWVWGSLGMMQRNYSLQKEVDYKKRQLELVQLQTENLNLQKRYYQTEEYQELAIREALGLVRPGEKVLVLPPNTNQSKDDQNDTGQTAIVRSSNLEQWMNFLFGGYSRSIADD